jgi:hypothetical protein
VKTTTENHRGVAVSSREPDELTNREAYLRAHPEARRVHDEHMKEFRERFAALADGLKPILHGIVDKAEQLRQLGIVLVFFCDTLPGGRLTRDLYEQHKHEFLDGHGQSVPFELLEWSIKVARENLEPIDNLHLALKYKQPLLVATGELAFVLESAPPPQKSVPPPDALADIKKLFNPAAITDAWSRLKASPHYFRDGKLRDSLRLTLLEEWKPTFAAVDEIRRQFGEP